MANGHEPTACDSRAFNVLIPARLASTRLPGKVLAEVGGYPMVVRVAQQALASGAKQVVVATDATQVAAVCRNHGVEAVLTRADHACGSDRLAECCQSLGLSENALVVNVQGDEPLIEPTLIQALAQYLANQPKLGIATVAHPITRIADWCNPNIVKVVLKADQTALYFSRAPVAFWRDGWSAESVDFNALPVPPPLRHIGVYAYRVGFLKRFSALEPAPIETTEALEQLRALWHGFAIGVHITSKAVASGVDTPQDLQRVRALLSQSKAEC